MAMNRLSKQAEQRLTEALEKVATLVAEGEHPNDAIVKIASASGIPAGHVNLMVTAFNTGRTETQRKIGSDIFEKSAEFDLADAEDILNRMYPQEVKTAAEVKRESVVSDEYKLPPVWHREVVKKATFNQELPPLVTKSGHTVKESPKLNTDPAIAMKHAHCQLLDTRREIDNKRAEVSNLQDTLLNSITKLSEHFRRTDCEPYLGVKGNMTRLFGKKAEALFSILEGRNRKLVKQAGTGQECYSLVDFQKEPYSLFRQCLDQAEKLIEKKASFEKFEKEANSKLEGRILPFGEVQNPSQTYGVLESVEKKSFLNNPYVAASIIQGINSSRTKANTDIGNEMTGGEIYGKDKAYNKAVAELSDPQHIAKLRNMQTSSMLTDLMANDEIISGYDPEEVINHYNEISQMAPRAAGHEGVIRAFLRKRLEGGASAIDPYDVKEILGIENSIKQRDTNPYLKTTSLSTNPLFKGI